jgi:hypothetical protein
MRRKPPANSSSLDLLLPRQSFTQQRVLKRWKSVRDVDALRAKATGPLADVWLHGKLLSALMLERRMRRKVGDAWSHLDRERVATGWRVWGMLKEEIGPMITGAFFWEDATWEAGLKTLAARAAAPCNNCLPT